MKKWKVCGLCQPSNIKDVLAQRPDMLGFIFYPKSPRYAAGLAPGFVRSIPEVKKVGVFVDSPEREMLEIAREYKLDSIQLHGQESKEQCLAIRRAGFQVIKAISVAEAIPDLSAYTDVVDLFLFDTKGKHPGGNGHIFDWKALGAYDHQTPFFLSGGLNPDNLSTALQLDHPSFAGVDLNSGFELAPGIKDIQKLKRAAALFHSQTIH